MSGKGILVGCEMISRSNYQSYDQTVIEVNLNTASVVSSITNNNLISVLDFQAVFTAFFCAWLLLLSQSADIIKEENRGLFYMPLFVLAINLVAAIGVSFIALSAPAENVQDISAPQETAKQVRL